MLRKWEFHLEIDFEGSTPIYKQISEAIVREIQRGRLAPGMSLPGSRTLATYLDVNRKTITTVYEDLTAQGWLETREKSGTFVSKKLPLNIPQYFVKEEKNKAVTYSDNLPFPINELAYRATLPSPEKSFLSIDDGFPDVRLAPVKLLGIAYRRAMEAQGRRNLLGYSDALGHPALRREIALMLRENRGLQVSDENVCITRGSQMGLFLIASLLIQPGDVVVVEEPGYPLAREVFSYCGALIKPVAVDTDGLCTDSLEVLLKKQRIKAVFLTPHHQYPTTVTLQADRRIKLLQLASEHRFAIIEDDYDHEFHFARQPVMPLASVDREGHVIYTGSMSKLLAPAVRIGYIVAPPTFVQQLGQLRSIIDKQGDPILEQAVAELIEEGEIKRHTRRAHGEYQLRRNTLSLLLKQYFGDQVSFITPAGGLAMWLKFDASLPIDRVAELSSGVNRLSFLPSVSFSAQGEPLNALRFGFASKRAEELETVVKALRKQVDSIP